MDRETRVTPWHSVEGQEEWEGSNIASYRIWHERTGREWWQRHEWKRCDGSTYSEPWIHGVTSFPAHAVPVAA